MAKEDSEYLRTLADVLDKAVRYGNQDDSPEGTRWVKISDTLAKDISKKLREIAHKEATDERTRRQG